MRHRGGEAGDMVLGWLLRLVVTVGVFSLVVFEVVVVVLAAIRADDAAGEVARVATVAYGSSGSFDQATTAAEEVVAERDVELTTFEQDGATLMVEVSTRAETLVLHHLPGTDGLVTRTASRTTGLED